MKRIFAFILCLLTLLCFVTSCASDDLTLPPHECNPEVKYIPPTCSEPGYNQYECSCKKVIPDEIVAPPTGIHTFSAFIYTVSPTFASDGYKYKRCLHCNHQLQIEVLPKLTDNDLDIPPMEIH